MKTLPCLFSSVAVLALSATSSAFTITAVGNAKALTNINQMTSITGAGEFEEGQIGRAHV